MRETDRTEAVRDLFELRVPVARATNALHDLPWDADELVELSTSHVAAVLTAYDAERLTGTDLVAWAEAVEVRDDVGRIPGQERLLNEVLMALSAPELFGGLDAAVATVRERLGAAG